MKGKDNFSFCGSSLNDNSLYLEGKKAWIHRRKVLNSLCSRSCIVPFVEDNLGLCLSSTQSLYLFILCVDTPSYVKIYMKVGMFECSPRKTRNFAIS